MDGPDKAALFLLGLGEKNAAEILKLMPPMQVQKVGLAMKSMANSNSKELHEVMTDFVQDVDSKTTVCANAEDFIKNVLVEALGDDTATPFIDRILEGNTQTGIERLKWLDGKIVADLIRNEHPQIVATILIYLEAEHAADVISYFDDDRRVDLVLRMSSMKTLKAEALAEIASAFENELSSQKGSSSANVAGIQNVAEIVNHLDSSDEASILKGIEEKDSSLCALIKDKMFVFENLSVLDDRSMQTLLKDVNSESLVLALKGASESMKEKIFSNMSSRAADLVKDDLEAKGPVKVSDVEKAQKEILASATKLAESGEIVLGKGAEEMI